MKQVRSLGWEDPLEEGMAPHSSILAWRIPTDRGARRAQYMGSHRVRHDRSDSAHRDVHGALECRFLTTRPPGKSLKVVIDGKIFSLATY